jgi:DNA-directed RNA polymerase beta subunit
VITQKEKISALKDWMDKTRFDPEVNRATLGEPVDKLSGRALLLASQKLIRLNRREAEPDDRDNLRFSTFLGLEDFVYDHLEKDAGRLQRKAKMKMQQRRNLDWLTPSFFTPQVKSVVIGNSLAVNVEGINPLEHLDNAHRVTKMGEGGIAGPEAVPDISRQINPSSFGFIDPLHVSESDKIGVTQFFAANTLKGKDRKLYKLVNDRSGKPVWVDHETLLQRRLKVPEH